MDGENNGKPYFLNGWFGGTTILGDCRPLKFNHQQFQVPKMEGFPEPALAGYFWDGFPLHEPYKQLI